MSIFLSLFALGPAIYVWQDPSLDAWVWMIFIGVVGTAAQLLLAEALRRKGYVPQPIALGTNTDPYQPVEKEWRIMRGIPEVLWEHRHPVTITTKGALITRDIDLLGRMAREGLVHVSVSLTTLDSHLSRAMEPRAASP
mgnify:CR=1 FL=1